MIFMLLLFLFFIGIIIFWGSKKISALNQKMTFMFDLISALTEQVQHHNNLFSGIQKEQIGGGISSSDDKNINQTTNHIENNKIEISKIIVSDDEEEEGGDIDDNEDDEDDNDEDDNEEDDNDEDDEDDEEGDDEEYTDINLIDEDEDNEEVDINIDVCEEKKECFDLNNSIMLENLTHTDFLETCLRNIMNGEMSGLCFIETNNDNCDLKQTREITIENLEEDEININNAIENHEIMITEITPIIETTNNEPTPEPEQTQEETTQQSFNIDTLDIEYTEPEINPEPETDYRKMNLKDLRRLASSKGITTNVSKLNKDEIIKLLLTSNNSSV